MPWTRKQTKYLLSKGSPLTSGQKTKMKGELHANPAMGHKKKSGGITAKVTNFKFSRPKRKVMTRHYS